MRKSALIAGRVVVALMSALVLTLTGMTWSTYQQLQGMGSSLAIGKDAPKSLDGAQNILVMGLTTRLDQNGKPLPKAVLDALHAGDGSRGGYNTNTMIVLHVPNDGSMVQAVSVPRDDYVHFKDAPDGQKSGKLKEAYGLAKDQKWNELSAKGVKDQIVLEQQSREAGRMSTIANVQELLNIRIDHFAEISLAGFYDLASQLGGIDVCLNNATKDSASGANFPKGRQHLDGAQALSFVRQRNGLPGDDLGRTHRQQAFLAAVTTKLKDQGVFGNIGKIQGLIGVAKKDVVIDQGWDLLAFAEQAQNLTSGKVQFTTLPIKSYGKDPLGSDINVIDVPYIQAVVHTLFSPPQPASAAPTPASTATSAPAIMGSGATVDVGNGANEDGMAVKVADALAAHGFTKGQTSTIGKQSASQVFYGNGAKADADKVAQLLGRLPVTASSSLSAGHIAVSLGQGFALPASLQGGSGATQPSTRNTTVAVPTEGPQGGTISGGGVPCVD